MHKFNPDKLSVEYRHGITPTDPIIPRRYTLTHSDKTGNLFLTIGYRYASDKINPPRDEVIGEWNYKNNYVFYATVYIDGKNRKKTDNRNRIILQELPLALKAIRYGDRRLFLTHSDLDKAPIYIYFRSIYPEYNRTEYWGIFSDYIS
ncbi:staygreen family protein [Sporohalobacter salinus]|uniref:staygreen family protein n=1 Tax=Sporohalobacter salinus TaxID=1494606 RepID=UPI001960E59A|nr:staygreen family protein [Sporohalobacter salinus]MBM7624480.1 hypothetical protein [Sporohalobacter salinus]